MVQNCRQGGDNTCSISYIRCIHISDTVARCTMYISVQAVDTLTEHNTVEMFVETGAVVKQVAVDSRLESLL